MCRCSNAHSAKQVRTICKRLQKYGFFVVLTSFYSLLAKKIHGYFHDITLWHKAKCVNQVECVSGIKIIACFPLFAAIFSKFVRLTQKSI